MAASLPRECAAVATVPSVLFVNSGILGHKAVARVLTALTAGHPGLRGEHEDLSGALTIGDRAIRRAFSLRLAPSAGPYANLDFLRWRQELNVGWLAARRIRAVEQRLGKPFDVLHFHPQATAYGSLSRMTRTPSIVSIDATTGLAIEEADAGPGHLGYRASVAHDGAVFRRASAIISTSSWAARDVAARYPDCGSKVRVLPYPIDASLFDAAWIAERAARTSSDRAAVRVLFVGGDFPRKGGAELLSAWQRGRFAGCAELNLVTDWPLAVSDLPPSISLVGGITPYSDRWFDVWRHADLFVMPTRHEAFGMVFQEAAAAGLPVVATNLRAVPEIVQDGVTGLLVQPGDEEGLVRAMRALVDSSALREQMGRAARARIEKLADPRAYSSALGEIVTHVVTAHAAHS
jgi:glycosyltransferase involved in cell wall biosynthesis